MDKMSKKENKNMHHLGRKELGLMRDTTSELCEMYSVNAELKEMPKFWK